MPYISADNRWNVSAFGAETAGDLNYEFTMVIVDYLTKNGLSYQTCNDIVGALDNCKDEFRRRVQHPYEDKKIQENGDVYPEELASPRA